MKKDFYPDRTVCSLQLEVKRKHKDIKKLLDYMPESFDDFVTGREEILEHLGELYKLSKSIHYKATRMEKRLMKYRKAIEGLGFNRKEK